MKARLERYWERLRTSYWFIPTVMAVGAVLLSFLLVGVDQWLVAEGRQISLPGVYSGSAEGARQLLSTVAGSMITVAGVTFSITIVALTLASSQFGPRLLYNFMRDTGNQVVLGTFVATFLYCLLALRHVRGIETNVFVPHLSVTFGVGLAVVSIGVLIYFIHHVAESIDVQTVLRVVAKEMDEAIARLFPEEIGAGRGEIEGSAPVPTLPPDFESNSRRLGAPQDGYLQTVDGDQLLKLATTHQLLIRLDQRPGDFVVEHGPLATLWPREQASDELCAQLQKAFLMGAHRTPTQDVRFVINQVVEVGVRALSPGVNDPFTAMACVDRLEAAITRLAHRSPPSPYRYDDDAQLRVVGFPATFAELVDVAFNQLRQHAREDVAVSIHILRALASAAARTPDPEARQALLRQAQLIQRDSHEWNIAGGDLADVERHYQQVVRAAQAPNSAGHPLPHPLDKRANLL